jgi:hypothetical protein
MSTDKAFDKWHKRFRHLNRNDARIAWDAAMREAGCRAIPSPVPTPAEQNPLGYVTKDALRPMAEPMGHCIVAILPKPLDDADQPVFRAAPLAHTPAAAEGQADEVGKAELWDAINEHVHASEDMMRDPPQHGANNRWVEAQKELKVVVNSIFAAPLPRQAAVQDKQADPLDSKVIAISRDSLMQIAKRLIGESLPECDEEFMAARAHGIGSLHAEILMAAPQSAPDQAKSAPATTEKEA